MPNHEPRTVTLISPKEKGTQIRSRKQNRNDKCACGSGKKSKNCCGSDTKYY